MNQTTYQIAVANDTPEIDSYITWLRDQGHDASISNSGTVVDGVRVGASVEASEISNRLWDEYCNG